MTETQIAFEVMRILAFCDVPGAARLAKGTPEMRLAAAEMYGVTTDKLAVMVAEYERECQGLSGTRRADGLDTEEVSA